MYNVIVKKRVAKAVGKLPLTVQHLFANLLEDLEESGPVQTTWPHYSKLSKNTHHCHLGYRHVACWRCEEESIEVEVYYAGSREDAPY